MKTLFMLTDNEHGGAQNICRIQAEHLTRRGVDARLVNVRQWHSPLGRGVLHKAISLVNMARGIRRLARANPDAAFFSAEHHGGVACFLAGIPCQTRFANDPNRFLNRVAWIIYSNMLVWNRASQLYFLHQSLLDDCAVKPLWGRDRLKVLENPDPQHRLNKHAYSKSRPIDAVYVGRLHDSKNPEGLRRLIDGCDFGRGRVRIFGDGPDAALFKKIFPDAEFMGWHENPWAKLNRPSVMFITSHFEGWPGVVMEAFATGVVVVSTVPSVATRFMVSDGRGLDLAGMDEAAAVDAARAFLNDTKALNTCRRRAAKWIETRRKLDYGAYAHKKLMGDMC